MNVKKIVEIINKNGRQGPKDLKSKEVFEWVQRNINITYEEYMHILNENAIHQSERETNRNAFFVIEESGKYQLFKSNEEELRKYVCYIIRENPGITSSETIDKFGLIYQGYTIIDLMDQKNLSSNQEIYEQTVRNILVSNFFKKKNNILFNRTETKPFRYTLTEEGLKLASEVDEILLVNKTESLQTENEISLLEAEEIAKGISYYTEEELAKMFEENKNFNLYDAYDEEAIKKGRLKTDPKLKTTRFHQTGYCCEYCETHTTFKTPSMPNFVLAHHFVPMATQKNFASIKLDCINNLVSLCPNCHYQIHYGTREAKLEIFNKILEIRKNDFEAIGFTTPILKVIFDTYY